MHVTCVVLCNAERKNGAGTRDPRVEGWLTVVREARSCSVGTSYTSFWGLDPAEPLENWRAWKRRESALSSMPIQNNEHCGVWVLTPSVLAQTKSRCYMKRLSAWHGGFGAEKTIGSPFEHGLLTKESLWMGFYIITLLLANKNKKTKAKTTERGRAERERGRKKERKEHGEKGKRAFFVQVAGGWRRRGRDEWERMNIFREKGSGQGPWLPLVSDFQCLYCLSAPDNKTHMKSGRSLSELCHKLNLWRKEPVPWRRERSDLFII